MAIEIMLDGTYLFKQHAQEVCKEGDEIELSNGNSTPMNIRLAGGNNIVIKPGKFKIVIWKNGEFHKVDGM